MKEADTYEDLVAQGRTLAARERKIKKNSARVLDAIRDGFESGDLDYLSPRERREVEDLVVSLGAIVEPKAADPRG